MGHQLPHDIDPFPSPQPATLHDPGHGFPDLLGKTCLVQQSPLLDAVA
jgi:hypothetical protein